MKTIGLIGGMSWESTSVYYRIINELVRDRLGGLHSAKCLLYSVDFAEIEPLQRAGEWAEAAGLLADAAMALQRGGADCVVMCTNTMHRVADEVQRQVTIPLLHIVDAAGEAIRRQKLTTVGLLGTLFTMAEDFYRGRLAAKHGLRVMVPNERERQTVHRVIYEELCQGRIERHSKDQYVAIMAELIAQGCEGVILGCTEIGLLVGAADCSVPLFDTTRLHAEAAVGYALDS